MSHDPAPTCRSELDHRPRHEGYHSTLATGILALTVLVSCIPVDPHTATAATEAAAREAAPRRESAPGEPWAPERAAVVERVNAARAAAGLGPFHYDGLLERVGDQHCRDLIVLGGRGHFSSPGTPPYLRYYLAGGTGFHRENAASYDSNRRVDSTSLRQIVLAAVDSMLAERPPKDGHRQTILDPVASLIGVGLAVEDGTVRMTHEVATQLTALEPPPACAPPLAQLHLGGRLDPPWMLAGVEVAWEPLPGPMDRARVEATGSYSYPPERSMTFVGQPGSGLPSLSASGGGRFVFQWRASPSPGVEVITVWASRAAGVRELTAVAGTAVVVTEGAVLPPELERWRDLVPTPR